MLDFKTHWRNIYQPLNRLALKIMALALVSSGPVHGQMVVDAVMGIADSTDFVVLDDFQNFSQIDNSGNIEIKNIGRP